jgi:AcrR family transcriptional regulator
MTKGEQTREAILSQALDQASVQGLEGLSIGALASRAGMSKSGLFAHFGSKEALQLAVLKAAARQFTDFVIAPARREGSALARLRALLERWLDWTEEGGLRGGCIFLSAAIEFDDREGPVRDYIATMQKNWLKTLVKTAERAVREGSLAPGLDCERFAHEIHGIYLAYHQAKRLLRDPGARARALRSLDSLIENARQEKDDARQRLRHGEK